jgi:hypothetical protein
MLDNAGTLLKASSMEGIDQRQMEQVKLPIYLPDYHLLHETCDFFLTLAVHTMFQRSSGEGDESWEEEMAREI